MNRLVRLALSAALLTLTGCGLSVYEAKMAEEQERLDYLDEESRALDAPVQVPEVKEGNKVLIKKTDVFFRPPRGVSTKPGEKTDLLNLYKGRGSFPKVALAVARNPKEEDFRKEVLQSFNAAGSVLGKKTVEQRSARPPRPVTYSTAKGEDATNDLVYFINFHKDRDFYVAVVFAVPTKDEKNAKTAMDLSLASLAVGARAAGLHRAFRAPATPAAPKK
jgi:hypothetical protein